MCSTIQILQTVICLMALVKYGLSLRCWKCSSDYDSSCRDYFNTTKILQNQVHLNDYAYGNIQMTRTEPHQFTCEGLRTSTITQFKNVCIKQVIKVPNSPNKFVRECRLVSKTLKTGQCPSDVLSSTSSNNLVHCSSCEHDGCNSATRKTFFYTSLIPALVLLIRN
ncbi:hypothetical protein GWI33_007356 [Rhynchophorus ferrugineus]|uniref:Protein sleepless n=1 Tax=Rhynchophorus ferrugineus TaxID=354439 RepID=A0A834MC82_RHYFE|nr:hypothetical protein GWI33_007356 [Rhynchophorus ferrugineus]